MKTTRFLAALVFLLVALLGDAASVASQEAGPEPQVDTPNPVREEKRALPGITLNKTVGTDQSICAVTDLITVPAGTDVTYCYEVTNTGDVTLTLHDLVDSELGTILNDFPYSLAPAASAFLTQTAQVNTTTGNAATWTAFNAGPSDEASAVDTARVNVSGGEPLVCNAPAVTFDSAIPPDWSVLDNEGTGVVWIGSGPSGYPTDCGEDNYTGGAGGAACASSDAFGTTEYDTELRSPPIDLTGYITATLSYLANYQNFAQLDFLDLDISTDGGSGWTNLLSWNEDHGAFRSTPGEAVSVDLSAYVGLSGLILRWRYYDPNAGDFDWYAEIDDISLACSGGGPDIAVTPASLRSDQLPETQAVATLTISNTGSGDLNWTVVESPSAPIAPTGGSAPVPVASPGVRLIEARRVTGSPGAKPGTSGPSGSPDAPRTYAGPLAVLYDQTDNPGANSITSQEFDAANSIFDNQAADDFVVPASDGGWAVEEVYVAGVYFNGPGPTPLVDVYFYEDSAGLPGSQLYAYEDWAAFSDAAGSLTVDLSSSPAVLSPGTYWVSVRADMDFTPNGQWGWTERTVQSNSPSTWRNPGDGFGTGCVDWSVRTGCNVGTQPDLIFQLVGETSCGTDVPWVSVSPAGGTTPPGGSTDVTITFDSTGLGEGFYTGSLCVNSDDPDEPSIIVPLTLVVYFVDVPPGAFAYDYIHALAASGVTAGCAADLYCPNSSVTRAQMAVFLKKGIHGADYLPLEGVGLFDDVPDGYWAEDWIEALYNEGITAGCSTVPLLYCPEGSVTRAQMAVFLLKSKYGSGYAPLEGVGIFDDVPDGYWAEDWIEALYNEGITAGCSVVPPLYCPEAEVTRAQMAVFLVKTFGLPLP